MIKENLQLVRDGISEACAKFGRAPEEVTLIAVSKNFGADAVIEAYNAGQLCFGENRAQEFREKSQLCPPELQWHFIGHLQTNKVKYLVGNVAFIHSIDSVELVQEVQKYAVKLGVAQKILIEFKTSEEESKFGITTKQQLLNVLNFATEASNVEPVGLMTIAPFTDDEQMITQSFVTLRNLRDELQAEGYTLPHLSMGMSSDYQFAIREGATMVRVGSSIFGTRVY